MNPFLNPVMLAKVWGSVLEQTPPFVAFRLCVCWWMSMATSTTRSEEEHV